MTVDLTAELAAARVLAIIRGTDTAATIAAGAQFVVTPAVVESIPEAARRGLPAAGALTPTEAYNALLMGASAVKLFPASLGGPAYLKALRDPFPDIPFVAVGGVGLDEMHAYLAVGAVAVGVGGPLVGDAASGGSLSDLRVRARAYVAAAGARSA
jgi:2-dehydro-3-deoxyphosphogluconate aldolase/(4S)-4-hydroxy-2-oxoglutarate aldolase